MNGKLQNFFKGAKTATPSVGMAIGKTSKKGPTMGMAAAISGARKKGIKPSSYPRLKALESKMDPKESREKEKGQSKRSEMREIIKNVIKK